MAVILLHKWRRKPTGFAEVDWSNPLTRQLVFAALPMGPIYYDAVTRVIGTPAGTITPFVQPNSSGKSVQAFAEGAYADGTNTTEILWPVSSLRGGDITTDGTILALAATTEQVDGKIYTIGGNTEVITAGDGFGLGIDSFASVGRGNVLRTSWSAVKAASANAALGNPFNNQLHFFGYGFSATGADGDWFYQNINESWTAQPAFGTTTTNRRARLFTLGNTNLNHNAFIALLMIWGRRLATLEYKALYENPFQLFRPQQRRIFINAAAAATAKPWHYYQQQRRQAA